MNFPPPPEGATSPDYGIYRKWREKNILAGRAVDFRAPSDQPPGELFAIDTVPVLTAGQIAELAEESE